jgi:3-dehydroquinate synthase
MPDWNMDLIEREIKVSWSHRLFFTDHIFNPANPILKDVLTGSGNDSPRKAIFVLDEGLTKARPNLATEITNYFGEHPKSIVLPCTPVVKTGGEQVKSSWSHVEEILEIINAHHIDRHSCLVTVGGGALLDMTGLAAATAHRGVRHVRIPTTTLSQCDSGVGVKNGINAFEKKNFIGTFCPPVAVINDFQLLSTLEPADKRAGYVEAVKVACIRDGAFFDEIESAAGDLAHFEPNSMRGVIRRCAELHVRHIAEGGDPFEYGSARPLDFGHWAAHKLEQLSEFKVRHGAAVAIGIALDVIYAKRMGLLDRESAERILSLLESLGFELFAPELVRADATNKLVVLGGLDEFREHLGGQLAITLLRSIGKGFEVHEMNTAHVIESIHELASRHSSTC